MQAILHPLATIGGAIRNAFFFPNLQEKFSAEDFAECAKALDPTNNPALDQFNIENRTIHFTHGNQSFYVDTRFIESKNIDTAREVHTCLRIGGGDESLATSPPRIVPHLSSFAKLDSTDTALRLIQYSPFDITVGPNNDVWRPSSMREHADVAFAFIQALHNESIIPDSMICHSMGSAILEGLETREPHLLPNTLILDRALPSVWKVGRHLMNVVRFSITYPLAYISGWSGYPKIRS